MLFSIIVPVYKVEKYIRQCVDSILAQTFSDFELILVDDGSPDNCPAICDDYAKQDSRIIVIHKENGGSTSSRKAGLNIAKGKYIVAVDSDDFVDRTMLEAINEVLQENDYDIVCFDYDTFPYTGKRFKHNYRTGGYDKEQIENEIYPSLITGESGNRFPPSIWGKALKKELVLPILNDLPDEIVIGEDSCVSYVSVYLAESIYILHDKLYFYRIENQSLTRCIKKAFSWDEPFMRADFYLKYLPQEKFDDQIARITAHSLFNIAVSVLKTKVYREAKKEIKRELSKDRAKKVLEKAKFKKNKKERLALYCLRHKKIFSIKMISRAT